MLRPIKILLFFSTFVLHAQYSATLEEVLKKAKNNRTELEKALQYSIKTGDSLKIKAMQFLIANMDIHSSSDYYWEDTASKKIPYNELDYSDFGQAKVNFETIKDQNPGLHPKPIIYKDIETITADYLIQNLERAFASWQTPARKTIPFTDFCEYILPYRITEEPLQNWRETYEKKFNWINEKIQTKGFDKTLFYIKDDYDIWFTNTWGEQRKEPLPRLGALQLLFRKEGPCPDIANLGVFIMRSQGIPATVNIIPFWATSSGGHFMNTFFDKKMQSHNCDYGSKDFGENLKREPAKVLRLTYSKQPTALASFEDKKNIPSGVLRQQNYIDVTKDYWNTTDIKCPLFPVTNHPKIVYATTFNGLSWKPFWWGKVEKDETVFTSLCTGTAIIPQYYDNGKLVPAGPPVIVGENGPTVLIPNMNETREAIITEKEKYLKFKLGTTYTLFYWNKIWIPLGNQVVNSPLVEMKFEKVPKNTLLLLIASDSKGLERPFILDENGNRIWY